ncbi:MAG: hypothetical protein KDF59_09230 [Nitrosomonas sp.]|nr:hypothetical protein [Nitrosomonas sp.]
MNSKYSGMTVNERLFEANLISEFDEAARERNKIRMVELLKKLELTESQANETSEAIIKNPTMYGH